jgi:hypothetical protein
VILFFFSCVSAFKNKKPCAGKRMAEKSYCDLAPFGGITRIRFKGFVQDVSAVSAPPLFWESKKEEVRSKREILPPLATS